MNENTKPFNVVNISREDFDRIGTKPDNYLFFVLDKIVKDESIVNVYSLYKGNVQVGVGDIIGSLPDSMRAANGGFRASAFTRSETKPEKPRESDFGSYYDLVNSRGAWQSRPDNLSGTGQIWMSLHWFTGSPAETLDTGDAWTEPVRLTGLNGADGKDGLNGADGKDGLNGVDGLNGKDGADGSGVFIRFNSSVSMPALPTGIGIDGGWSSNQKEDSRWISLKQGRTASEGKWGEPVQIKSNLIRYDASDGSIRDEWGNRLGMAFSPVYTIDTEQVIPLTVLDRYKFDTSTPLRVNCYVSTPRGSRALLNPEDYELMCKVRDSRTNEETTFALEYANKEWLLPLADWYDKSNATDFIELHLFARNGETGSGALAIKLIELVRDGEAGKITSVKAETLVPGSQATVRNEGDIHDAKLVFGIPKGDKGERGDPFMIKKTYPGVEAMNADFGNANVPLYSMVLIDTGNVEDEDNAKLYIKDTTGFLFLTDLSGAQGIKGEPGEDGADGAEGMEGLGIFHSSFNADLSSKNIPLSSLSIPEGRSIKVGDFIIANDTYSYLFRVNIVTILAASVTYITSLRGAPGAAGSDATVTVDSSLSDSSTNPVQNKVVKTELGKKADIESPIFTGNPSVPTQEDGNRSGNIANTYFVHNVYSGISRKKMLQTDSRGSFNATAELASRNYGAIVISGYQPNSTYTLTIGSSLSHENGFLENLDIYVYSSGITTLNVIIGNTTRTFTRDNNDNPETTMHLRIINFNYSDSTETTIKMEAVHGCKFTSITTGQSVIEPKQ